MIRKSWKSTEIGLLASLHTPIATYRPGVLDGRREIMANYEDLHI
jgi:hypothetical protein